MERTTDEVYCGQHFAISRCFPMLSSICHAIAYSGRVKVPVDSIRTTAIASATGSCQCNCLHRVRWHRQIAEAGWRSQWTLSRQYRALHCQLLGVVSCSAEQYSQTGKNCFGFQSNWIFQLTSDELRVYSHG